jgi:hypothetical protein
MKIAGTTYDVNEGEEIEDIVKVFIIASRVKNLPDQRKKQIKNKKVNFENEKEKLRCHAFEGIKTSLFLLRGIN